MVFWREFVRVWVDGCCVCFAPQTRLGLGQVLFYPSYNLRKISLA